MLSGVHPDDDPGGGVEFVATGRPTDPVLPGGTGVVELVEPAEPDEFLARGQHGRAGQAGGVDGLGRGEGASVEGVREQCLGARSTGWRHAVTLSRNEFLA
ncbi:hypothetical protein JN350_16820 [Curtobacterium sp. 24E2]|nr:hypothetical protein JN350_16820 [Curtobacterium sp. 24E2]